MATSSGADDRSLLSLFSALVSNISQAIVDAPLHARALPDDEDADVNWAQNRIALTALIISLVALVATLLQVILEYAASSPARYKCSAAAIQITHRHVRKRWSFAGWRWKYYYPAINFESDAFIAALVVDFDERSVETSFLQDIAIDKDWDWYCDTDWDSTQRGRIR
jgi:hypothetical protein